MAQQLNVWRVMFNLLKSESDLYILHVGTNDLGSEKSVSVGV